MPQDSPQINGVSRIKFNALSDIAHVYPNEIRATGVKRIIPHLAQEPLGGKDFTGVAHQKAQQIKLDRGKQDFMTWRLDLKGPTVKGQIAHL
jgi:hypothetical protein